MSSSPLSAERRRVALATTAVIALSLSVIPSVASIPMFIVMLLIMLTGLGLVIYAVAVIPKQQEIVRRVTAALQQELPGKS